VRALVLGLGVAVSTAGPALACGVMISEEGSAELDGFEALLSWEDDQETMLVAVRYTSAEDEFAWMMPFPAAPEVDEGTIDPILAARDISTPPLPPSDGDGAGAPQAGVDVIDREVVGDLEFVTLGGEQAAELQRWMRREGFAFHDTQEAAVQEYLDQEWVIVAARVLPGAPAEGEMVPVRFRFDAEEPVYPLRVAGSSHSDALPMELYVVTPFRPESETYDETIVRPDDGAFPEAADRLEIRYSAPLTQDERSRLRSPGIRPKAGAWLTRYEATWRPETLGLDLVLRSSPVQEPVAFDEGEEEDGLSPVAMIAIAAAAALVLLLLIVVISRRRRPGVV
jgi:hypothetical protein